MAKACRRLVRAAIITIAFAVLFVDLANVSLAATVEAAKGQRGRLSFQADEKLKVGDRLVYRDLDDKLRARATITEFKNGQAIVDINAGLLFEGNVLTRDSGESDEPVVPYTAEQLTKLQGTDEGPADRKSEKAKSVSRKKTAEKEDDEEEKPPEKASGKTASESPSGGKSAANDGDQKQSEEAPEPPPKPEKKIPKRKAYLWTIALGESFDSQSVLITSNAQVSMTGHSPLLRFSRYDTFANNFKGAFHHLAWEAGGGIEELKTSGSSPIPACASGGCTFDIPSLTLFGRGGWYPLEKKKFNLGIRAGVDFLIPISVNSNVVRYSAFEPLMFLTLGIQAQLKLKETRRIPLSFDAAMYIGNSAVTINRWLLLIGYAWR